MHFIGHTRFSLFEPDSTSWRLSRSAGRKSEEAYLRRLYSEERMQSRQEIFFNYSLPILDQAQSGMDLIHVVSYSDELPARYQIQLKEAANRYSWLLLDRRDATNRKGLSLENIAREHFNQGDIFAEYRLDDDDVLAVDYFESLSAYLSNPFVGFHVSHGLGLQTFYENEVFFEPRYEHRPKIAIGLARVCSIGAKRVIGPKRAPHTKIDQRAPVILDSRSVKFLHSLHLSQDSGEDKPSGDLANRFRNYLKQEVPKDCAFHPLFPGVAFGDKLPDSRKLKALVSTHSKPQAIAEFTKKAAERIPRFNR